MRALRALVVSLLLLGSSVPRPLQAESAIGALVHSVVLVALVLGVEDSKTQECYLEYGEIGSGVIIYRKDKKYYILTTFHLLRSFLNLPKNITPMHFIAIGPDIDHKKIKFSQSFVIAAESKKDLLLFIVTRENLLAPKIAKRASRSASRGKNVLAIGNPGSIQFFFSKGVISGTHKEEDKELIISDVEISPGSSGGPLFNSSGELTGLVVGGITTSQIFGRVATIAISIEDINEFLGRYLPKD